MLLKLKFPVMVCYAVLSPLPNFALINLTKSFDNFQCLVQEIEVLIQCLEKLNQLMNNLKKNLLQKNLL